MHGLVAVDHDARRIFATLVRVAQLDAPAVHERRLVHRQRALERACQVLRAHVAHGGFVGVDHVADELAHARAMARRDEMHRRVGHEIQLQGHLPANLVALLRGNVIPLVHGDDQRAPALKRKKAKRAAEKPGKATSRGRKRPPEKARIGSSSSRKRKR